LCNDLQLGGIRFDAVKHFSEDFLVEFIEYLTTNVHENLFFVGTFPPPPVLHPPLPLFPTF
jgi:hypothetical protein